MSFSRRLDTGIATALSFEDRVAQATVREHVDFERVFQYLCEEREKRMLQNDNMSMEEMSIVSLMRWFKCDFFKWCNKPACDNFDCDGRPSDMDPQGMAPPTAVEEREGGAYRVEVYRCRLCNRITRFPRYNKPAYMVKHSRRGRCGEFANVFGMLLRSLGYDVRYVLDFTDHVWVEVWIEALQRFVHCDPCERALDSPMVYEGGWKKKLTHVISCSRYGVDDAISRYSRSMHEVLSRRGTEFNETAAQEDIELKDIQLLSSFISQDLSRGTSDFFTKEFPASLFERFSRGISAFENLPEIPEELMDQRRTMHKADLESMRFLPPGALSPAEARGRTSGDLAWRQQRGEIQTMDGNSTNDCGADENALCTTGHDRPLNDIFRQLWQQAKASGRYRWLHDANGFIISKSFISEMLLELPFEAHIQNTHLQLPTTSFASSMTIHGLTLPLRKEGIHLYCVTNMNNALYSDDGALDSYVLQSVFGENAAIQSSNPIRDALARTQGGIVIVHLDSSQLLSTFTQLLSLVQQVFHLSEEQVASLRRPNRAYIIATAIATATLHDSQVSIVPGSAHVLSRDTFPLAAVKDGVSTSLSACLARVWIRNDVPSGALSSNPAVSGSSSLSASFEPLDNCLCSSVKEVLFSMDNETLDTFQTRAMSRLLIRTPPEDVHDHVATTCTGFSIVTDHTATKLTHSALFFDALGASTLRQQTGAKTWILSGSKCSVADTDTPPLPQGGHWQSHQLVVATFHDVGGGHHGDTVYWDGTNWLRSSNWSLSRVHLWAGTSLTNGVQCEYVEPGTGTTLLSPIFSSSEGSPQQSSFSMGPQHYVTALQVRAGSLIDGMSISRSDGQRVTVGGSGGSLIEVTWHPNDQETLLGFFGGCGGHLHNVGVVIKHIIGESSVPFSAVDPAAASYVLSADVLQVLYDAHGFMNDVKYINTVSCVRVFFVLILLFVDGWCHDFCCDRLLGSVGFAYGQCSQ